MNDHLKAPVTDATDEDLMQAYQQGDRAAFEELFGRYQHRVYGFFVRSLGDAALAADLFHESFLRVHRARASFDPSRSFATWLFGIAANLKKDEFRRRARRPGDTAAQGDASEIELEGSAASPETNTLQNEQRDRVQRALAALPADQRDVVILHKLEGFTFPEIAELLGEGEQAVKSRAFRGYRALRGLLADLAAPSSLSSAPSALSGQDSDLSAPSKQDPELPGPRPVLP